MTDVVKISDFGFAKMIIDEEMKNNPTDGTSVGNMYSYHRHTYLHVPTGATGWAIHNKMRRVELWHRFLQNPV